MNVKKSPKKLRSTKIVPPSKQKSKPKKISSFGPSTIKRVHHGQHDGVKLKNHAASLEEVQNNLNAAAAAASASFSRSSSQEHLTPFQQRLLRAFFVKTYGSSPHHDKYPSFTYDSLIDVRVILGRWLRPAEVRGIFGKDIKLFSRLFKIEEADGVNEKTHISSGDITSAAPEKDPRISFVIGKNGVLLTEITRASGCLHVFIHNRSAVTVYAPGESAVEAEQKIDVAAALINETWKLFSNANQTKRKKGDIMISVPLMLTSPPGLHTMQVSLNALYKSIAKLSSAHGVFRESDHKVKAYTR